MLPTVFRTFHFVSFLYVFFSFLFFFFRFFSHFFCFRFFAFRGVFSSRFGDYYSFSPQFPVPTGCALQVSCFDWDIILPLLFLWNFVVSSNYTGTYNFPYISVIKTCNNKHYLHDACRYSTAGDNSLMWVWHVNTTLARYTWRAIRFCLRLCALTLMFTLDRLSTFALQ